MLLRQQRQKSRKHEHRVRFALPEESARGEAEVEPPEPRRQRLSAETLLLSIIHMVIVVVVLPTTADGCCDRLFEHRLLTKKKVVSLKLPSQRRMLM